MRINADQINAAMHLLLEHAVASCIRAWPLIQHGGSGICEAQVTVN